MLVLVLLLRWLHLDLLDLGSKEGREGRRERLSE